MVNLFIVVLYACTQRLAVWLVADFEALSYQVTTTFDTGCATRIRTAPAINYTACYQLGVFPDRQWFEICFKCSHSVFCLKRFSFLESAKSAVANRQALLQFLV
jgi:hypothetical protein